jgi:ATP-dependent DNA helicase RecG
VASFATASLRLRDFPTLVAVNIVASGSRHEWRERATEPLPGLSELGFLTLGGAIHRLHIPESLEQAQQSRQRLAMNEFVELQSTMLARRRRMEKNGPAVARGGRNELICPFPRNLGFDLTGAQTAVLRDIRGDLAVARPMRRLVQGDVRCGKTVVAACAILWRWKAVKTPY